MVSGGEEDGRGLGGLRPKGGFEVGFAIGMDETVVVVVREG